MGVDVLMRESPPVMANEIPVEGGLPPSTDRTCEMT